MDASPLQRFVDAQDDGGSFERAVGEIERGRKTSHWIWWVFPQIEGLGFSERSRFYAIASLGEARDYLDHPVLSTRLHRAVDAMLATGSHDATAILDGDDVKFHSSLTLFHHADPGDSSFEDALARFFGGECDSATHRLIGQGDE
jgi:uncharacterized protein (DUF1810 family)